MPQLWSVKSTKSNSLKKKQTISLVSACQQLFSGLFLWTNVDAQGFFSSQRSTDEFMLLIPGKAFLRILLSLLFFSWAQDNSYSLFPRHLSTTKSLKVLGMRRVF